MDPSLRDLVRALSGLGSSTIRLQRIDDFQTFILSHVPYGQVSPDNLQTGLIEFDGPSVNPVRPALQWHFGGVPYPIVKAARIDYSYTRVWDGSGSTVNASILLGLQAAGAASAATAPTSPATNTSSLPGSGSTDRDIATALLLALPTTVISGAPGFNDITSFLQTELSWNTVDALRQTLNSIEFDGPAQGNDSHNPFAYTLGTLFNEQALYNQLLWWYFGGKANRVTKAIRIPLPSRSGPRQTGQSTQTGADAMQLAAETQPAPRPQTPALSLLVGFTGPGTFP